VAAGHRPVIVVAWSVLILRNFLSERNYAVKTYNIPLIVDVLLSQIVDFIHDHIFEHPLSICFRSIVWFIMAHFLVILVEIFLFFHDKVILQRYFFQSVKVHQIFRDMNWLVLRNMPIAYTFLQIKVILETKRILFFWE
jgi:hypothetical protein